MQILKVAIFLIMLSASSVSLACKCSADVSIEDHFSDSSHVFRGRLVSVQSKIDLKDQDNSEINKEEISVLKEKLGISGIPHLELVFEIIEVFKGDPKRVKFFITRVESSACGIDLEFMVEYVVFVNAEGNIISRCNGTQLIEPDSEERKKLLEQLSKLSAKEHTTVRLKKL